MHNCIKSLTIHLVNSNSTYSAGEIICGSVDIVMLERLKINGLKIQLTGEGRVEWTEKFGKGRFESMRKFSDTEKYVDVSAQLLSRPKGGNLHFEVGEHKFKFMIQLPAHLPTSFEHSLARIRYYLVATIDIPWNLNKVFKMPITIIDLVDLNLNKSLRMACSSSNSRTLCCFCCRSKPIICSLGCQKSGFVAGESINFDVSIDNQSTRYIEYGTLKLMQNIKLCTKSKSRLVSREVAHMKLDRKVDPFSHDEWHNSMFIPSVCPSTASHCRLLDISYSLELHVFPSWSSSIKINVPICIGTVPFHQQPPSRETSISDVYMTSIKSDLPSYMECVLGVNYMETSATSHLESSFNQTFQESNEAIFSPLYPNYTYE